MKKLILAVKANFDMTEAEAKKFVKDEMMCVLTMIQSGDHEGAEEYFEDVFGLEPDYLLGAM